MPRYAILIEYDGTIHSGWQRQASGSTVQQTIEDALGVYFGVARISLVGSGRTDAGVHARGQVAHFDLDHAVDLRRLERSLGALVAPTIAIRRVAQVPQDFHARFDATRRRYHYQVSLNRVALDRSHRLHLGVLPDFARMNTAADRLKGTRHFGAFCLTRSETTNRCCTVSCAEWIEESRDGYFRFEIEADRFLHGMVRAIVGTLLEIGTGKRTPESIDQIMESRDRRLAGATAPAHALVLDRVQYRVDPFAQSD